MANASVSGLVSGLDSASIVNQLIQVEARQQTLLKTRRTSEQSALSSLQGINSRVAALATAATALGKPAAWSPLSVASSSTDVVATLRGDASPGTTSLTVVQTARGHRLDLQQTAAATDRVTGAGTTVRITRPDGTSADVETGDGTLGSLVSAINASDTGLRATTLRLDDGRLRLSVESRTTGAATAFELSSSDGQPLLGGATVTAGRDAAVTVGGDTVHSATNSFAGVLGGLDVQVAPGTEPGTVVRLTVTSDTDSLTSKVKALVDAANAALASIGTATASGSTGSAGPLNGDAGLRSLRDAILGTVTSGGSMAAFGVQTTREGRLTFDATTFAAKVKADPAAATRAFATTATYAGSGTVSLVSADWRVAAGQRSVSVEGGQVLLDGSATTGSGSVRTGTGTAAGLTVQVAGEPAGTLTVVHGLAARLAAVAERASDSTAGSLTTATKSRSAGIERLTDAVEAWDDRLAVRRTALERQYAALEVALGKLQNQSTWLSGQLASLNPSSS